MQRLRDRIETWLVCLLLRDVPLEDAVRLLRLHGIEIEPERFVSLSDTMRGRALQEMVEASVSEGRPALLSNVNDLEVLSKAGADAVMRPAAGQDPVLLRKLSSAPSDRARALCLYLHEKPSSEDSKAFERAWVLSECGAHRPNGATWQLFEVASMSRDWCLKDGLDEEIKTVADAVAEAFFKEKKEVRCDVFSRPALPDHADGPKAYCFMISLQGDERQIEGWKSGSGIRSIPLEEGRRFCASITPHQKTFEFGRDSRASELAQLMTEAIASTLFKTSDLEPVEHGTYVLDSLVRRRDWPSAHEHGIETVLVKKLVLTRGAGTVTYHVPARFDGDVYDVLGKAADRLSGDQILSATLRVPFKKQGRQRAKTVQFEITRPNKCTLRETHQAEALILNTYLPQWGLRDLSLAQEGAQARLMWPAEPNWPDLLAGGVARRHSEWRSVFGEVVEDLIRRGVLVPAGRLPTAPCPACAIGDLGDYKPLLEEMICNSCGHCEQDSSLWMLHEMDSKAFGFALALLMQLKLDKARIAEADFLFCLGESSSEPQRRVLLAPQMLAPHEIDRVTTSIKKGTGKSGGLLIGPIDMPESYKWPHKHTFMALREVLRVGEDRLELQPDFAAEWFGGEKTRARGGRPTYQSHGEQLAKVRRVFGLPVKPELLLEDLKLWFPDAVSLPNLHTIQYEWKLALD